MRAMILAAGRGSRMAPLTDDCPKPLLEAGGKPLIVHQIERLRRIGVTELVINVSYLAERLIGRLGDGTALGVDIRWSVEPQPLETAGGIRQALGLLGDAPFLLVNGDVWSDFPLERLTAPLERDLARLVMIPEAAHHPGGDFHLTETGRLRLEGTPKRVYAGIALIAPELCAALAPGEKRKLVEPLRQAIGDDRVAGVLHRGEWLDVGTPERLGELDARLRGIDRA
ncbi:N-acetylmuramate alpha-1-phosphate uridylyltransferase MurU [Halotalea alkalilenta]|uniref:N-acetylmuramate alpha-1-phosphate uridylyltransferase MurU n=1 Tax=Halotalea alkalilenta TaxID=376489 RepID=UPI00048110FE|nr:nucleotidyltransferase family protein [Halotalea alkalilenta]